jgi:chromatin assembly factor 1 subunit A
VSRGALLFRSINNPPQAKQDLLNIFESLAQEQRDVILDPKGPSKLPPKQNPPEASKFSDVKTDILKGPSDDPKKQQKKKEDEENDTVRAQVYPVLSTHRSPQQSGVVGTKGKKTNKSLDPERAAKVSPFVHYNTLRTC